MKNIKATIVFSVVLFLFSKTSAQRVSTYFIDNGFGNVSSVSKQKIDVAVLVPFKKRFNLQLAYSPIKKISLFASAHLKKDREEEDRFLPNIFTAHQLVEKAFNLGVSFDVFNQFSQNNNLRGGKNGLFLLDSRFGYSNNSILNTYVSETSFSSKADVAYHSFYAELISAYKNNFGVFSFNNKLSRVRYKSLSLYGEITTLNTPARLVEFYENNQYQLIFTTDINYKMKMRKLNLILGLLVNHNYKRPRGQGGISPAQFYVGVNTNFNTREGR